MSVEGVVKATVEPAVKLVEAVGQVIGKAYEPRYVRRMADAKAYEARVIAEELRNNSDLPIVYNGDRLSIEMDTTDFEGLKRRAGMRLAYQEIRRQENIEAIVATAYDEARQNSPQSDEPINSDWMNRFIAEAAEVSDEEMRSLWARVLAGEAVMPGSFSLRTLNCLRDMTTDDAKLFEKVCSLVIHDRFVINDMDVLIRYGISYDDVLRLDECGLLNSSGFITQNLPIKDDKQIVLDLGRFIVIGSAKEAGVCELSIGEFPLTLVGRQLLKVARSSEFSEEYVADVFHAINKDSTGCTLSLHKVTERKDNTISYDNKNIANDSSRSKIESDLIGETNGAEDV